MKEFKHILLACLTACLSMFPASAQTQANKVSDGVLTDNTYVFLKGRGTKQEPFIIDSYEELVEFREYAALKGDVLYVRLNADIDLGDDTNWVPIRYYDFLHEGSTIPGQEMFFQGQVDGDNHSITHMTVNKTIAASSNNNTYVGLFGRSNYLATFKQLNLKDIKVRVNFESSGPSPKDVYVGGLLGLSGSMMSYIHADGEITIGEEQTSGEIINTVYAGGVAGKATNGYVDGMGGYSGTPEWLEAHVNISTQKPLSYIGGIAGVIERKGLRQCTASGTLTGQTSPDLTDIHIGGIVGDVIIDGENVELTDLCTTTQIAGCEKAGGLVGEVYTKINWSNNTYLSNCISSGAIYGQSYAGGFIGHFINGTNDKTRCIFKTCLNTGTVRCDNPNYRKAFIGNLSKNNEYKEISFVNCYYDNLMTTDPTDYITLLGYTSDEDQRVKVYGYPTEELTGKAAESHFLITPEDWKFEAGRYPQLKTIQETTVSQLAAVPMLFEGSDNASRLYQGARLPLAAIASNTGEWTAPLGNGIISKGSVEYDRLVSQNTGYETLTLTSGGHSKQLDIFMAYSATTWEGEDNIPTGDFGDVFSIGDGGSHNPYIIMNGGQLAYAVKNNKEGQFYRLGNDIILNRNLLSGKSLIPWIDTKKKNYVWKADLDGYGYLVHGMYLPNQSSYDSGHHHGLVGTIANGGSIHDMGMVEAVITDDFTQVEAPAYIGLFAGTVEEGGSLTNCFALGDILLEGVANVYAGGLAGQSAGTLTDCMGAVSVLTTGNRTVMTDNQQLGGIVGKATGGFMTNCLSVGRVSHYDFKDTETYSYKGGICANTDATYSQCIFDNQATSCDASSITGQTAMTTNSLTDGSVMATLQRWQAVKGRYPMLKLFANNDYAILASLPIVFSTDERSFHVKTIFSLPSAVEWSQQSGTDYLHLFADQALAEPQAQGTAQLRSQLKSKDAKYFALRNNYLTVGSDVLRGIQFEDPKAEEACVAAFGNNKDYLSLEDALKVTDFSAFTQHQASADIVTFPELRYFGGITNLTDELKSCSSLTSVTLPVSLERISADAFDGCASLQSVSMPVSLTFVAPYAFRGSNLKEILTDDGSHHFISRDGVLFDTSENLVAYPPKRAGSSYMYTSPLTGIKKGAFLEGEQLTTLYLGDDLGQFINLAQDGIPSSMQVYINDATDYESILENYCDEDQNAYWPDFYDKDQLGRYYPLTITSAHYATMCIYFDTQLPEGLTAYYCRAIDEETKELIFQKLGREVPATLPVLIYGKEAGVYPLFPDQNHDYSDYELPANRYSNYQGSGERGTSAGDQSEESGTTEGSILTLGRNSKGELGFFAYRKSTVPPYRAYLVIDKLNANPFTIVFEDNTNDIVSTTAVAPRTSAIYDLSGRKVADNTSNTRQLPKGIYIKDGRKFIIK
ncbi:MAG: leucine-rich repeat protein [Prevotella sp.]|nr:leucine-rich repeat protein [Prevotella sp.]